MNILDLALALIVSKLLGEGFIRLKQMEVLGELFAGIIFAFIMTNFPIINLNYFGHIFSYSMHLSGETFNFFADMGIILLLFIVGMETSVIDLKKSGKRGLSTASLGVAIPFVLGAIFSAKILGFTPRQSFIAGAIFTATSVGVTVRALMDLKQLRSVAGTTIITAAIIDDIAGIMILTFVLGAESPAQLILGFIVFSIIIVILAAGPIDAMMHFSHKKMHSPYAIISIAIGFGLLISVLAKEMGLAPITGAYFAGLLINRTREKKLILSPVQNIARAIFIPIFFVKVGALFDFRMFTNVDVKYFFFLPLAFIGKFVGCGTGSLLGGIHWKDAVRVGIGMMPEMEVALVISTFAYSRHVFPDIIGKQMVSITILYVIISAIIVPIFLKMLFPKAMQEKVVSI